MKARIKSVSRVKVTWFYEDDIYLYESVPGSILVNPTADVVRFELRDLYEEDDNFEVINPSCQLLNERLINLIGEQKQTDLQHEA